MPRNDSTDDTASAPTDDATSTDDRSPPADSAAGDPSAGTDEPIGRGPLTPASWRRPLHDERAIRKATSAVLGGLAVLVVLFLLSLLPGLDADGRAFAALASGTLATSFAAVIGYAALVVPWYVRTAVDGPRDLREPGLTAAVWALVLAAVLTLHRGFAPLVALLDGPMWLYDGLFLLAALVPVAMIARALWELVTPAASYLTGHLTDAR